MWSCPPKTELAMGGWTGPCTSGIIYICCFLSRGCSGQTTSRKVDRVSIQSGFPTHLDLIRPHNTHPDQFQPSTQGGALEIEPIATKLAHPLTNHHSTAAAPQKHNVCTQCSVWGPLATALILRCRPAPSHKAVGTPLTLHQG